MSTGKSLVVNKYVPVEKYTASMPVIGIYNMLCRTVVQIGSGS